MGLGCGQNAAQEMLAPPSGFDPQLKPGVGCRLVSSARMSLPAVLVARTKKDPLEGAVAGAQEAAGNRPINKFRGPAVDLQSSTIQPGSIGWCGPVVEREEVQHRASTSNTGQLRIFILCPDRVAPERKR